MNDRQIIVKALKAIASAFSFCDTDMELALRDRLNTIHEAIEELANDDSAPKNGVSDNEVDANDANAASVSVSKLIETRNGDNGAACQVNGETCLTGQAVDKQADSTTQEVDSTTELLSDGTDSREKLIRMQVETIINLQKQVDELQRKLEAVTQANDDYREEYHRLSQERMNLARDLGNCMAERDQLREKYSKAIDHALAICNDFDLI